MHLVKLTRVVYNHRHTEEMVFNTDAIICILPDEAREQCVLCTTHAEYLLSGSVENVCSSIMDQLAALSGYVEYYFPFKRP